MTEDMATEEVHEEEVVLVAIEGLEGRQEVHY